MIERPVYGDDGQSGPGRPYQATDLPRVALEILRGRAKSKIRPISMPTFLIGSATDCDLVLGDSQFPAVHTYLRLSPREVSVRHLGFLPTLYVNGTPVASVPAPLTNGDVIRTGPYEFAVRIEEFLEASGPQRWRKTVGLAGGNNERFGTEQVAKLLASVRRELVPEEFALRLYVEPDYGPHSSTLSSLSAPSEIAAT